MSSGPQLYLEPRERGVVVLRIDRPPANAFDGDTFDALAAAVDRVGRDPAVRAVVVTGTGRFFSAGLDLVAVFSSEGVRNFASFARAFDAAWLALFGLPKPVVAAVNGHAIAGGTVLAACADVRLVAEGTGRMGLTEILVGVPFPVSAFEPVRFACAGPHLVEVLQRGRTYTPPEAVERRLADEVVPAASLLDRAVERAAELGAHLPAAFAATKRALRADALARMAAMPAGTDPIWALWQSAEVLAAVEDYRSRALGTRT